MFSAIRSSGLRRIAPFVAGKEKALIKSFSGGSYEQARLQFPGSKSTEITHDLEFSKELPVIPTFQALSLEGKVIRNEFENAVGKEDAIKMYKNMLILNAMDQIFYESQRQGRISFYMTSFGEEAIIGSSAALGKDDVVFGQYREAGVLLQRGFPVEGFCNQCLSNSKDLGRGRQMPVHYGSRELNFQTISSPLATQIPQAVGAAYALRRENSGNCVICYFGDGAASEGDFHAGLNMAATLSCPVIFYCRNNGYAISTPSEEQYKGDGIARRGIGYGIHTLRIDGNDILASFLATQLSKKIVSQENKPVLIEAMTYRVSHHSTSDDSTAYRSKQEVEDWSKRDNPISRTRKWLENNGWWSQVENSEYKSYCWDMVLSKFSEAEKIKKPSIDSMFEDVYESPPKLLLDQKLYIQQLLQKYPDYFDVNKFE